MRKLIRLLAAVALLATTLSTVAIYDDHLLRPAAAAIGTPAPPVIPKPAALAPVRSVVNGSFEDEQYTAFQSTTFKWSFSEALNATNPGTRPKMPGWQTTHPSGAVGGVTYERPIEYVQGPTNAAGQSVSAADGTQFIELNALVGSAVYQDLCVAAGESVDWSVQHRSRAFDAADRMKVTISNPASWSGTSPPTTLDYDSGTLTAPAGQNDGTGTNGWGAQTGTWTGPTATGARRFAFSSVDAGAVGNWIDNVQVNLPPLVEFLDPDAANGVNQPKAAADGSYYISFGVNGRVATAAKVNFKYDATVDAADFTVGAVYKGDGTASAATATKLVDGTVELTVPAGLYDPNDPADYLSVEIVPSATLTTVKKPAGGLTLTGGGIAIGDSGCTQPTGLSGLPNLEIGPTGDLSITKTSTPYSEGSPITYTVTASNTGPGTATNVTVADTFDATFTNVDWTCAAAGGATCTAAGNGNISDTVTLPPSGQVVYTITASGGTAAAISNTATVTADTTKFTDVDLTNNTATVDNAKGFACDGTFYIGSGAGANQPTTISTVDVSNTPATLSAIGPAVPWLGPIGYNKVDGFLYAIAPDTNRLVRIGAGASVTDLGTISGLPATGYNAGDISPNGTFYVTVNSQPGQMYAIDLTTTPYAANLITITPALPAPMADFAVNPADGNIYGAPNGKRGIYRVTSAGASSQINSASPWSGPGAGAQYFDANGNLYLYQNVGELYRFNVNTPATDPVLISSVPAVGSNDGASCPVPIEAKPGVAKNMTYVGNGPWTLTIDYAIRNYGNDILTNMAMADDLQAVFGVPGTDWTLTSITKTSGPATFDVNTAFDGATAGDTQMIKANSELNKSSTGTDAIAGVRVVIQLNTPGTFTNQVTLTGKSKLTGTDVSDDSTAGANPDPDGDNDPTNNADPTPITPTATIPTPNYDLAIDKTNASTDVAPGGSVDYTVTVTNNGPDPVDIVQVRDTFPADLTCSTTAAAGTGAPTGFNAGPFAGNISDDVAMPASSSVVYTSSCTISATAAGPVLTNTATVDSPLTTAESDETNNTSSEDDNVGAVSDLAITKIDLADPVVAGTNVTYRIGVVNNGPSTATGVVVTDTLPPGTTLVTAPPGCAETGGVLTCPLSDIALGSGIDIDVTVTTPPDQTTITNNASIATTANDPDPSNNAASADTALTSSADVSITKVDAADPISAGSNQTYTVTVTNAGPSTATGVVVTDTLPAGSTVVSLSGCAEDTTPGTTCTLADIAPGANAAFDVTITTPGTPGTITNTVDVATTSTDPDASNNQATADTVMNSSVDLSITKTDAADPAPAGANLTYTVEVTNAGPSTATGVVVTDTLPTGTAVVSTNGCAEDATPGTTCTLPDIASGATASFTITVSTPKSAATLTNSVSVATTSTDSDATNNTTTEDTVLTESADLSITKTDAADPISAGTNQTYTVTVTNAGPSNATGVVVTDTLPAGATLVSTTGCAEDATPSTTCTLGSIAAGATKSFDVVATTPGTAGTVTNSVSVAATTADPDTSNNTASADTVTTATANVAVVKTAAANPSPAGANLTYTVTVANAGPSTATGVVVTDTLPAGSSVVSTSGCAEDATPGTTCTLPDVASGGTASFDITIATPSVPGPITNQVSVATTSTDPDVSDNTATENTNLESSVDLSITKTDAADPVVAGTNATYTITVSNAGPSTATGVQAVENLPTGASIVSTTGCPEDGTPGTMCSLGDIAPGASKSYEVVVKTPSAAGTFTNQVGVITTANERDNSNNVASEETTLTTSADVSIAKTDAADPVNAGTNATYTITVANAGPSNATGVVVTDTLPAGTSVVSTNGCTEDATPGATCTLPDIAAGASESFTITITTPTSGASITNGASVATTSTDPDATNNSVTEDTALSASADLSITKADAADPIPTGSNATYTITVSNAGPSDAAAVVVTETLPAGATLVSTTGCAEDATPGTTCTVGALAAGDSASITVVATLGTDGVNTNSVTVASSTPDPDNTNNTATADTTAAANGDLAITKTATPLSPTQPITYTITVKNTGASTATGATVTDTFDASTTGVTWTCAATGGAACTASGTGNISDTVTIPAGATITYTATGTAGSGTSLSNTATVAAPAGFTDTDATNNSSTVDSTAQEAVPGVAKQMTFTGDGPWTVTIDYAIANFGPVGLENMSMPDDLSAVFGTAGTDWSFVSIAKTSGPASFDVNAAFDGSTANAELINTGSALSAAGSDDTAAIQVVLSLNTPGAYTNQTTLAATSQFSGTPVTDDSVAGTNPDPDGNGDPGDDGDPSPTGPNPTIATPDYDLQITKDDGTTSAVPGATVTYTIVASNNGPDDVSVATVTDAFPAALTCSTVSVAAGGASGNNAGPFTGNISETLALPANGSVTYTATCQVGPTASGNLDNTASIDSPLTTPESDETNNVALDSDLLGAQADLEITKTDAADPVPYGTDVTYTVAVTNNGPSTAANVVVTETLPAGATLVSTTGCAEDATPGTTCTLPDLAPAATASFTVTMKAPLTAGTITNTVDVTSAATDPVAANNQATEDTVLEGASIELTKTAILDGATCPGSDGTPLEVLDGSNVIYCFEVTNNGDLNLGSISIDDPALGLTGATALAVPDLNAGQTQTVQSAAVAATNLSNTATVTGQPVDGAGTAIPGVPAVTATDGANVSIGTAGVALATTVGTGTCPGTELLVGQTGTAITYCFELTNSGSTPLDLAGMTFADTDLGITATDLSPAPSGQLAAGAATTFTFVPAGGLTADLVNTATATLTPLDSAGNPLTGASPVSASDPAEVDLVAPAVAIAKTIYTGTDPAGACTADSVTLTPGSALTWCFTVTNTGDTALGNVVISDPDATSSNLTVAGPLAPGASAVTRVTGVAPTATLVNTGTVTADAVDGTGSAFPGVAVAPASDTATVTVVNPAIRLQKTVANGATGACPGTEVIALSPGAAVLWCFEVTNLGDTELISVSIADANLPGTPFTVPNLAAGATESIQVAGTVAGDLINTATVTAQPADGSGTALATVAPVSVSNAASIGAVTPGSVAGRVWHDLNADGTYAAGEPGHNAVDVTLTGTSADGTAISLTASTDASGAYSFPGVPPSNATGYTVAITTGDVPAAHTGVSAAVDPTAIQVSAGTASDGPIYGTFVPVAVDGTVFDDTNGDGVNDTGETGVDAITVTLTGTDGLGNAVSTTLASAADGSFSFPGLVPGAYTVSVDETTAPARFAANLSTPKTVALTVISGTANPPTEFGLTEPDLGSVTGAVFVDANADGTRAATDIGYPGGATVNLTGTDYAGRAVSLTATTDAAGNYIFTDVPASDASGYAVVVDDSTFPAETTGRSTAQPTAVTIAFGATGTASEYGVYTPAVLAGILYLDADGSETRDAAEVGIPGVPISLSGMDFAGNAVQVIIPTLADGSYAFQGVPPSDTAGYTVSVDPGILPPEFANAVTTPENYQIVVTSDLVRNDLDIGVIDPGELRVVVFADLNLDGVNENESPVPGVVINLTGEDSSGASVNFTLTTDANGVAWFNGLEPSAFGPANARVVDPSVRFMQTGDFTEFGYTVAIDESTLPDGLKVSTTPPKLTFTLDYGLELAGEFGISPGHTITGVHYTDSDGDATRDPSEPVLSSRQVTISGTDRFGRPVSRTVTSNPDGTYEFTELPPSDVAGYSITISTDGLPANGQLAESTQTVTVGPEATSGVANFRFVPDQQATAPLVLAFTGAGLRILLLSALTLFLTGASLIITSREGAARAGRRAL